MFAPLAFRALVASPRLDFLRDLLLFMAGLNRFFSAGRWRHIF